MFAEKPYDDVFVEDIAARAGVSRALMYHYFPSKRDLYVAIFKRASHRFLARADPDLQLALTDQLANGLEAHIQYFADHPFEAIAINRGALSDDPAIQAIVTNELNIIGRRLIDSLVTEGRLREVTEIAVEGWLAFVRAACVKWVQSRKITRADLTDMCLRAFDCALGYPGTPQARPKELIDKRLAVEPTAVSPHPPRQSPPGPSIAAPTAGLSCGRPPPTTSSPKSNVAARPSARSKTQTSH
jgi:AcrR family transcriptional regulator